jgi:outer membrane lipoprotein SlyB
MNASAADAAVVRETVGAFVDARKVHEAIDELLESGFKHEELGLLASEQAVRESLGDFYTQTNQYSGGADAPNTAFVAKESVGDTVHAMIGSLSLVGSTVAAGAAVASAGIFGGALAAAVAGAAALGAVGAVLGGIIHESDAEELEEQIEEGHLLVFVRARDSAKEKQAADILQRHTPIEVKVVSAPRTT